MKIFSGIAALIVAGVLAAGCGHSTSPPAASAKHNRCLVTVPGYRDVSGYINFTQYVDC